MILERINFEDVINPQFAFPVVGVLLCALLVFAFGFKTPAQPPSEFLINLNLIEGSYNPTINIKRRF